MEMTTENENKRDMIIRGVEKYYGVTMKDMCVPNTQKYPDAAARDLLSYLLREVGGLKYTQIADMFGTSIRNIFFRINKARTDLNYRGKFYNDYQEIINNFKNE